MILRTGALDDNVYERSVLRRLDGVRAAGEKMHAPQSGSPFSLTSRHAGMLSAVSALNDLAVRGIRPEELEVTILLPENSEEAQLRELMDEIHDTAQAAGVQVTSCCAETGSFVTRPVVLSRAEGRQPCFLKSLSGKTKEKRPCGEAGSSEKENGGNKLSKQEGELLVIGRIGLEGTFLLASECRRELEQRFPVRMLERAIRMKELLLMLPAMEALAKTKIPVINLVNGTGGGIYAALWEMARECGTGLEAELPEIPIFQETIEFTDFYGINPYQMRSAGCLLAAVPDAKEASGLLEEQGIYSKPIGQLTQGKDKILINGEERQSLNRPEADSLLQILGTMENR